MTMGSKNKQNNINKNSVWYTEYTSPAFLVVHGIHLPSLLGYRLHLARITVLSLYLQVFYRWYAVSLVVSALHIITSKTNT